MNELALFAGAGGGVLAGKMLGWRTVCAVELDDYARRVLIARQDDGSLDPFPIWDDIRTFDGRPWSGLVDVISGGFPCQDISVAGKGAGLDGEHSGLWAHMARVIRDVRPLFVFVENSPALTSRGLGRVLRDMAALGFDAEWGVLGADDVGANHRRDRMWIVAHAARDGRGERWSKSEGREGRPATGIGSTAPDADRGRKLQPEGCVGAERRRASHRAESARDPDREGLAFREGERGDDGAQRPPAVGADWRAAEPGVRGVDDGLAAGLDAHQWGDWRDCGVSPTVGAMPDRAARLRCLGNGQVPQCAAEAWRQLVARGGWR